MVKVCLEEPAPNDQAASALSWVVGSLGERGKGGGMGSGRGERGRGGGKGRGGGRGEGGEGEVERGKVNRPPSLDVAETRELPLVRKHSVGCEAVQYLERVSQDWGPLRWVASI